ncbi:MAG TPA: hypothetical protein VMR41_05110 [Patescibacteria group bacterium]|nr:MAG: replication associated protein [Cressdnaviricota sp.]HUD44897.1 hypothetical protein [Patescibacteria group bacterium]
MPATTKTFGYCFTINNPTARPDLDKDYIVYSVYQKEVGANGTPHYQGFLISTVRKRNSTWHNEFGGHWSPARNRERSRDYAMKEETRVDGPWETGDFVGSTQGRRNDLIEFQDFVKAAPDTPRQELLYKFGSVMSRHRHVTEEWITLCKNEALVSAEFVPRNEWQIELSMVLRTPPHPRKIIWRWDINGNIGKSYFAANFNKNAYIVSGGKHSDIFHGYRQKGYPKFVFFDLPRDYADKVPYGVMESFKNGFFFSAKYESADCRFAVPHVTVFANFPPDRTRLSADRWDVVEIVSF